MDGASVVVFVALLVYAALAVAALRNRLLARVATREAIRRPLQTLVVVAGLTVGTGAILGPQLWYDSVTDSLIAAAYRSWGRVDLTVAAGGAYFSPDVARRLAADPTLQTSVAGVQGGLDLVGSVANLSERLGTSDVRIVGFDPAVQPQFGAYVLMDGARTYGGDLAPGEVLLSTSLADSLQAQPDDVIRVNVQGRAEDFTVAGIARPEGPGMFGLRPALFTPMQTARSLVGTDGINVVWMTANGDGRAEAEAARAAAPAARAILATVASDLALDVREVKAEQAGAFMRYQEDTRWVFLAISLLVMAIGAALVVNLVVSLAEERRPRLAVLRALGLSRSGLVTLSMIEGALYSLAAAVVSVLTGAAIAWVLFAYSADASLGDIDGRDIVIEPSVRPGTVAAAVAFGALITLLTVFVAAVRSSQMTIACAIRDLPDREPARRHSSLRLAGLVVLAVIGTLALLAGDPLVRFVGGWAWIAVASSLVRGRLPDRTRATVTGALLTSWGLAMLSAYGPSSLDLALSIQVYLLGVMTSVFGLAILVAANLRVLEGLAGFLGSASTGIQATLRPPLAYMTRRPVRAGLTTAALGLVIASITIWTVLALANDRPDYDRASGGFDVEVTSAGSQLATLPRPVELQVARSISIPTYRYIGRQRQSFGPDSVAMDWHEALVPLYELSDAIVRNPLARLSQRDARFASDADAWEAVGSDPTWVISNWWGGHGGSLWLVGREGPIEFKIAGSLAPGILDGIAGSPEALAPFADLSAGTTLLIQARPDIDPAALALEIRRSMFSEGAEASTTKALLDQGQVQARAWGSIFGLLSQLGLVVGVLSLGVLALRSVLERRHAIGVLRALGYQPRSILAGILIEATLTTALGIALGLVAGLEAIFFIVNANSQVGPSQTVDFMEAAAKLAPIYAVLLAVTLVVSIGPALRASRLAPVDALRIVD